MIGERMKLEESFTCDACKEVFVKARPDEEAVEEMRQEFGADSPPPEQCAIVCEDCYQLIHPLIILGRLAEVSR